MGLKSKTDALKEEVFSKEAYLCGLAWANPDIFSVYNADKMGVSHFGNKIWKFYWGLGRHLFDKQLNVFDDISVQEAVNELKLQAKYDKYGGFDVIDEMMHEVKDYHDNFEGYYDEVKKYAMLRELRDLIGDKVVKPSGKYDYKKMSREQIGTYWNDKLNSISVNFSDSTNDEFDLLDELESFIEEIDSDPDIGMSYYKSKKFTDITNGWAYGTLSILSAFSGNGKSSFVLEKLVMQCIHEQEKMLIIANEMDVAQYRKLLLITIMGAELYNKFVEEFGKKNATFNRKNLNKGNFTVEEKSQLIEAVKWVRNLLKGKNDLIKFVAMETYTMDNVEKTVRHYARRGYKRLIVDTAKPSEGGGNVARWEQFVQDFDTLYKLARANGGGLNLALFATVQNADTALNMRYLDERCLADGKKIKNVADVVLHMRPVWSDEYEDGANELKVKQFIPASKSWTGEYEEIEKTLQVGKVYYLVFVSKNRRGQTNVTGLDVLVYEANFNSNRWKEVGWAINVKKDLMGA